MHFASTTLSLSSSLCLRASVVKVLISIASADSVLCVAKVLVVTLLRCGKSEMLLLA
jgi:hypothetical protein